MRRHLLKIASMAVLMLAAMGLGQAQVPITLEQGWNWISYPYSEPMTIEAALSGFTPAEGDILKSQTSLASYHNGSWSGDLTHFMPGWGFMYYSMRTETVSFVFAQTASNVVATATPTDITAVSAIVGGMVTLPEGGHVFLRGVCWGTESNPDIDGDHTSEGTGIGSFGSTLEGLNPNTTYYVRAYAVSDNGLAYGNEMSFTTLDNGSNDHEYVNLGLPSGTLWATCNVGADSPEEYGDYFAWGETQPKDTYSVSTYQYCNGSYYTLTKYCNNPEFGYYGFTDDLTTLLPEDDAATANWGSDWRMPTEEEWQELYNNTTSTWTTQNGVNGRLFTASNGSSLFLPAACIRVGSSLKYVGNGFYWSSSFYTDTPYLAFGFHFQSEGHNMLFYYRTFGQSVRPVRSSGQNNAPTGAVNGKFTINDNGNQVYFSQGNLQYIGSACTPYWKFADNQWDVLGTTTGQNSSNQNVDRDLFGWGTSGWNNGNTYYQPWDTNSSDHPLYGPPGSYNLTGSYANADWGVYNPISNGGNQANQWRTLTQPEWAYVFNTRTTSSGIRYAKANVNNVNGVILLPDDWSASYYTLSNTNSGSSFSSNTITASQWSTVEQHGAVFLPAAGGREGTWVFNWVFDIGYYGYYWSASCSNSSAAYYVNFNKSYIITDIAASRIYGRSVRLVAPAEN